MKIYLSLLLIFGIFFNGISGNDDLKKANAYLNERGEVYFKFNNIMSYQKLEEVGKLISIDKIDNEAVYAYANKIQFDNFIDLGIDFQTLTPPSMLYQSILENSLIKRDISTFDYYPSYEEYIQIMNQFAADHSDICELVNLGESIEGREILMIHINNDLENDQAEPEFLYTSSMHGDELVGYILTLRLIDYLLENYGSDPEVNYIVNSIDIWINPLANPDGTYAAGNNSVWGATRGNANMIDLNRNFPDPEDGPHPDGNDWQPENIIMMDFADSRDFDVSGNMHGGAEVLNYPWDTWATLSADDDWWVFVSREYADLVHEYGWGSYLTGFNNGITNGYQWYSISGGRQDYMNYFHNCREFTMELSNTKTPPESELDDFWNANLPSLLAYMKQATYGFSGLVTNAVTGLGVAAEVNIESHDFNNSQVYASLLFGFYQRPIKEGNYDVTFSAFGFYDMTYNIDVYDYQYLELNVEMIPVGTLMPDFTSSAQIVGPASYVDFFDNSIGYEITSWEWTFEGAEPDVSTEQNPQNINYSNIGSYDVTLKITNSNGDSDTKVFEDYIEVKEAVIIDNTTVTICDAVFYDAGEENGDYSNDEDYIITFYPENAGDVVVLSFVDFELENSWNCVNDYMIIYDGADTTAAEIGRWCGASGPTFIAAENEQGAVCVRFHSNSTIVSKGWKAVVSCDSNVGINNVLAYEVKVFPNPANRSVTVSSEKEISDINIISLNGRLIRYYNNIKSSEVNINTNELEPGIYFIEIISNKHTDLQKLIITR